MYAMKVHFYKHQHARKHHAFGSCNTDEEP
jgi:hypothetical protein